MKASLQTMLMVCCIQSCSVAEYRSALIIDLSKDRRDAGDIQSTLQSFGFQCNYSKSTTEKNLAREIEGFARSTVTRGTALVWFTGEWATEQSGDFTEVLLRCENSRQGGGIRLSAVWDDLQSLGGSFSNLVVLDGPEKPVGPVAIPANCLLASNTGMTFKDLATADDLLQPFRQRASIIASRLQVQTVKREAASVAVSSPTDFSEGKRAGDEWVNHRGMVFCWCPAGSYLAGSSEDTPGRYPDERQRTVEINSGFWIGKYELTSSQNLRNKPRKSISTDKNHPINMLHHDDGRSMITRTLTAEAHKQGVLPEGWQYSLPTEEQWEYAARAGSQQTWSFGNDRRQLPQYANFADRSFFESGDVFASAADRHLDDRIVRLAVVGSYRPNRWGLHDVHGNVAEWCINHAVRGGSWVSPPSSCRSAYRDSFSARSERSWIGYRIVIQRTAETKP